MPNLRRGEIEAILDGRPHALCLTLGALAELEAAFGDDNMLALARRFEAGTLSARDCIRIIAAGLRGAGHDVNDDAVARMQADDGAAGYVTIVAKLLRATFGTASKPEGGGSATGPLAPPPASAGGTSHTPRPPIPPSPGTT